MTGIHRHIQACFGLVLLTGLIAGCHTTREWPTAEIIPPQVCGGAVDSDGDGVTECNDRCPGTLRGQAVDAEGCPLPEPVEQKPFRG